MHVGGKPGARLFLQGNARLLLGCSGDFPLSVTAPPTHAHIGTSTSMYQRRKGQGNR